MNFVTLTVQRTRGRDRKNGVASVNFVTFAADSVRGRGRENSVASVAFVNFVLETAGPQLSQPPPKAL